MKAKKQETKISKKLATTITFRQGSRKAPGRHKMPHGRFNDKWYYSMIMENF